MFQGENGRISYALLASSDSQSHFSVDSTGTIRIARRLDRETKNEFLLTLQAKDHGTPSRKAVARVQVKLRILLFINTG